MTDTLTPTHTDEASTLSFVEPSPLSPEESASPPATPTRRRGRPPGSRNKPQNLSDVAPAAPKNASLPEAAFVEDSLPRRGRRPRKPVNNLTPDQIADIILMAHTMGVTMIGPEAAIDPVAARRMADAMVPVMDDFGVQVAGKVVHVVVLVAALVAIEGPIALNVLQAQQRKAAQRVPGTMRTPAVAPSSAPGASNGQTSAAPTPDIARIIAAQTGLEVGAPA